jgi:Protein of unknown function (DUF3102)
MSEANIAIQFAQQELDALANTIRTADLGVARAVANMVVHAIAAGDALLQAKTKVGYGNWLKYLKDKCDLSEDRAERYMRLARGRGVLEADSARLRNLSLAQALRLVDEHRRKSQPDAPSVHAYKALCNEIEVKSRQQSDRLSSLAWSNASPIQRTKFLRDVGLDPILAAAPSDWDLGGEVLRTVPKEALFDELRRRSQAAKSQPKVTVLRGAKAHTGPILDITPTEETTTKH